MNPLTLLEEHHAKAVAEVDRLDTELERTRERWKSEEANYNRLVEEHKKYVAEAEAFQRVLRELANRSFGRRL